MPDKKVTFSMLLKKEGKHVAHYYDGVEEDAPNDPFKDGYMPHAHFEELGKPEVITVTIESGDTLEMLRKHEEAAKKTTRPRRTRTK
jgi:hypothetical protein